MDAMRYPTALLRIGFALALLYRFVGRSARPWASRAGLARARHWLRDLWGLGAARKQSIIGSVD